MLLTDARRNTRLDGDGNLVLLADQDRSRWDRVAIAEGLSLVDVALRGLPVGMYAVQAAVAGVHAQATHADQTDWEQIAALYGVLLRGWPSPVVALNRAVAVGEARGPAAGLAALDPLGAEPLLATYPYLAATRADFLRRLGRTAEARSAYEEALVLTENEVERRFLTGRLRAL